MSKIIEFDGEIIGFPEYPETGGIVFPFDLKETFGKKSVKARITFDGVLYRGLLKSMGGDCVYCLLRKDILKLVGKNPGDMVHVTVQEDTEERTVEVPEVFQNLLDAHPEEKAFFEKLSYTHRKEYVVWLTSAKREETRQTRLAKSILLLKSKTKTPN